MARQEHILTVFVASPSDVSDERDKLEEVIRELNVTWSKKLGVRLDLVRWETHTMPGFGVDAQDVINSQIDDDYDIFIGIMWHRFGTATARYGSGTEEEFERAMARITEKSVSINIMFYFRDSPPISMGDIDGVQLAKVQAFRSKLGKEGEYYWKYKDTLAFEQFIRMHLSNLIQNWKPNFIDDAPSYSQDSLEKIESLDLENFENDDDFGLIDYVNNIEIGMNSVKESVERSASYLFDLSSKIEDGTNKINDFVKFGNPTTSEGRRELKRIISRVSADMDNFADRFEQEIPIFSENFNSAMNSFIKTIEISEDFSKSEDYYTQINDTYIQMSGLDGVVSTSTEAMAGFRNTIASLPRMTGEINRSKRRVVSSVNRMINEMNSGRNLIKEASEAIELQIGNNNRIAE